MCEITTNFRLQLCIDMVLNQPFWYSSKVKPVFLVISCRKTWHSLKFFAEILAQLINYGVAISSCVHNSPNAMNGTTQFSDYHVHNSKRSTTFCFRVHLVNRSTKLHEILIKDTSIDSKCCVKDSERSIFLNSLTNCLRKKCEFPVFREGVPENWVVPIFAAGKLWTQLLIATS